MAKSTETPNGPKLDEAGRKALQGIIDKAGTANVLMYTGQYVNRNAVDVEDGFKFQRKAIAMAKKVPELAA